MEAVIKDPLGIGYNNLNYAFDAKSGAAVAGSAVVPIDVNGDGAAGGTRCCRPRPPRSRPWQRASILLRPRGC